MEDLSVSDFDEMMFKGALVAFFLSLTIALAFLVCSVVFPFEVSTQQITIQDKLLSFGIGGVGHDLYILDDQGAIFQITDYSTFREIEIGKTYNVRVERESIYTYPIIISLEGI